MKLNEKVDRPFGVFQTLHLKVVWTIHFQRRPSSLDLTPENCIFRQVFRVKRSSIFKIVHVFYSEPSILDLTWADFVVIYISACILILAMIWVCIIYIKYAIRRDRVLKKIEEIQKGPSETLALLGLTMMVPIAPGNFPIRISKISFCFAVLL